MGDNSLGAVWTSLRTFNEADATKRKHVLMAMMIADIALASVGLFTSFWLPGEVWGPGAAFQPITTFAAVLGFSVWTLRSLRTYSLSAELACGLAGALCLMTLQTAVVWGCFTFGLMIPSIFIDTPSLAGLYDVCIPSLLNPGVQKLTNCSKGEFDDLMEVLNVVNDNAMEILLEDTDNNTSADMAVYAFSSFITAMQSFFVFFFWRWKGSLPGFPGYVGGGSGGGGSSSGRAGMTTPLTEAQYGTASPQDADGAPSEIDTDEL